jgi:hypothetical protein
MKFFDFILGVIVYAVMLLEGTLLCAAIALEDKDLFIMSAMVLIVLFALSIIADKREL